MPEIAANVSTPGLSRPHGVSAQYPSRGLRGWVAEKYNRLHRLILPAKTVPSIFPELQQVRQLASSPSDIDEHLETMFLETIIHRPCVIVELGVRGGVSTFVFESAARLCGAWVVSVDVDDCALAFAYPRWTFVQSDDVKFAGGFKEFCIERNIPPQLDLLFVDTSHHYEHTVQEIDAWFPLLSDRAKVIFHDTNLQRIGPRKDGRFQLSWDNERGVARAIERYLNRELDMGRPFTQRIGQWLIRHQPNCNGLTIMDRL